MSKSSKAASSKTVYAMLSGANYPGKSAAIRRSYTIAAMIMAGFLSVTKSQGVHTLKKGDYSLFRLITRGKVSRVWSGQLMSDTAAYGAKVANSMSGTATNGYNGNLAIVAQFLGGMKHGGKVIAQDRAKGIKEEVEFVPVTVKVQ